MRNEHTALDRRFKTPLGWPQMNQYWQNGRALDLDDTAMYTACVHQIIISREQVEFLFLTIDDYILLLHHYKMPVGRLIDNGLIGRLGRSTLNPNSARVSLGFGSVVKYIVSILIMTV
jgi:hypothetical protein